MVHEDYGGKTGYMDQRRGVDNTEKRVIKERLGGD
jgi:hypothetical protein